MEDLGSKALATVLVDSIDVEQRFFRTGLSIREKLTASDSQPRVPFHAFEDIDVLVTMKLRRPFSATFCRVFNVESDDVQGCISVWKHAMDGSHFTFFVVPNGHSIIARCGQYGKLLPLSLEDRNNIVTHSIGGLSFHPDESDPSVIHFQFVVPQACSTSATDSEGSGAHVFTSFSVPSYNSTVAPSRVYVGGLLSHVQLLQAMAIDTRCHHMSALLVSPNSCYENDYDVSGGQGDPDAAGVRDSLVSSVAGDGKPSKRSPRRRGGAGSVNGEPQYGSLAGAPNGRISVLVVVEIGNRQPGLLVLRGVRLDLLSTVPALEADNDVAVGGSTAPHPDDPAGPLGLSPRGPPVSPSCRRGTGTAPVRLRKTAAVPDQLTVAARDGYGSAFAAALDVEPMLFQGDNFPIQLREEESYSMGFLIQGEASMLDAALAERGGGATGNRSAASRGRQHLTALLIDFDLMDSVCGTAVRRSLSSRYFIPWSEEPVAESSA